MSLEHRKLTHQHSINTHNTSHKLNIWDLGNSQGSDFLK